MKRILTFTSVLSISILLLVACRFTSGGNLGQPLLQPTSPASILQPAQPTSPAGTSQPGGSAAAEATLGQPAGQIDQVLNDLESTLQAQDTGASSLDTGQIDQSLNDLESTLQAQDTSARFRGYRPDGPELE